MAELRRLVKGAVPPGVRRSVVRLRERGASERPPGSIRLGDLNRTTPLFPDFGLGRGGTPVDRHYIEHFLARHAHDIRGRGLEFGDDGYLRRFGGSRVQTRDVLALVPSPGATLVADLSRPPPDMPRGLFDVVVCTQTLQFVPDLQRAVETLARLLADGGSLLVTVPAIGQISRYDADRWGDRWRLTSLGARELFASAFGEDDLQVTAYGNVLAATALLHGLVVEDLERGALDRADPDYELVVAVRAVRRTA